MDAARIYLEAYEEDDNLVESETHCLMIKREGETDFVFEARVQAHVDILNDYDEAADEEVGYDWELTSVVA